MRIVLDTSVVVAGLRSRNGASRAVLERLNKGEFYLAASPALFLEYEQVLKRREHRLPLDEVDGFLSELASVIDPVQVWFTWRPQLTDADDELVLEAAINGRADAIVTHNRKDFERASRLFGIAVWSPIELLNAVRQRRLE
jgi:putative PIN family toxin of toxin-antitoxin system